MMQTQFGFNDAEHIEMEFYQFMQAFFSKSLNWKRMFEQIRHFELQNWDKIQFF